MSLLAFLLGVTLGGAERWVVICICPASHTRSVESRIAVDAGSVDSAGNGIYHARLREWNGEIGGEKNSGVLQVGLQKYPYDRRFWRASIDCTNRRIRVGRSAFFNGSAPVPGSEPEDAPHGDWVSATPAERDGDLVEAFCGFRWKSG